MVATATELGAVVRWVRGERRVPMEDAAARSGVSRDLLRDLERAARGVNLAQASMCSRVLASMSCWSSATARSRCEIRATYLPPRPPYDGARGRQWPILWPSFWMDVA